MQMFKPLIFLSHTSKDDDIAITLDKRFTKAGIDCIVDKRPFEGSKRLTDSIYRDGIAKADAIVVVVSAASMRAPWVEEEISYATLQRVTRGAKIIPFVVEPVSPAQVAHPLQHLTWVKLTDYPSIDAAAQYMIDVTFGTVKLPQAGPPPSWTTKAVYDNVFSLPTQDEVFLCAFCKRILEGRSSFEPSTQYDYRQIAQSLGIDERRLIEILHALVEGAGLLKAQVSFGAGHLPGSLLVPDFTLLRYMQGYEPQRYRGLRLRLLSLIVNNDVNSTFKLPADLTDDFGRVRCILKDLDRHKYIRLSTGARGGHCHWAILPTARRALDEMSSDA